MTFIKWFATFLEEKNLPYTTWELQASGYTHFIDSDVVIENINNCSQQEQCQIKDVLVKIDFHNGNVMHFFEHLAQGLVSQWG